MASHSQHATLCVQGLRDGVRRSALEAEFEAFGNLVRVDIAPGNALRGLRRSPGLPDSRLAFIEYERRNDARRAMQAMNGRYVQGKCVMIQFARGTPGVRSSGVRRGFPEPIPQTPNAALLAAKFPQSGSGVTSLGVLRHIQSQSQTAKRSRDRSKSHSKSREKSGSEPRSRPRTKQRSKDDSRQRNHHSPGGTRNRAKETCRESRERTRSGGRERRRGSKDTGSRPSGESRHEKDSGTRPARATREPGRSSGGLDGIAEDSKKASRKDRERDRSTGSGDSRADLDRSRSMRRSERREEAGSRHRRSR